MKFIKTACAISLLLICIFSCSKDTNTSSAVDRVKSIEYVYDSFYSQKYTLTYDGNDRILVVDGDTGSYRFQYTSANSYLVEGFSGHIDISPDDTTIYILNSKQLVDSSIAYGNYPTGTRYIYNSSNQLTEQTLTSQYNGYVFKRRITYVYDANGNLITENDYEGVAGALYSTTTYAYTSYPAIYPLQPPYMPKRFKNLPSKITHNYVGGPGPSVEDITYSFDSNNRLATEVHVENAYSTTVRYTY